ncbi:MAG: YceI family protein [Jatrophihabitans sp.]|uniref:YceI family protein n=1 Tax=Jatrophihabitans sp. TaxID=1932789 RepID=UPI003F80EA74
MTASLTGLRTGRWTAASTLTSATFTVRHALGLARVQGCVPVVDASVDVDASGRPAAVSATLDLTRIDTGNRRRDADLQQPRLLDTASAPTLTFAGRVVTTDAGVEVVGRLAGRAAADVVLRVVEIDDGGDGGDGSVHVVATTRLDRRALGVRAPRVLIGRVVQIRLDLTFRPG